MDRDLEEPRAVPAAPDVDEPAGVVQPRPVPAVEMRVVVRLEGQPRKQRGEPDRGAAPEEDAERVVRRLARRELDLRGAASEKPLTRAHDGRDHTGVGSRTFTPDEANAALAEVRLLAERMVAARHELADAQRRHVELLATIASNGGGVDASEPAEAGGEVERLAGEVVGAVQQIQDLGAVVKDVDTGLVDFPAVHRGRDVLLCWRLGEDEVGHWHDLESGFAGRRPLPFD